MKISFMSTPLCGANNCRDKQTGVKKTAPQTSQASNVTAKLPLSRETLEAIPILISLIFIQPLSQYKIILIFRSNIYPWIKDNCHQIYLLLLLWL